MHTNHEPLERHASDALGFVGLNVRQSVTDRAIFKLDELGACLLAAPALQMAKNRVLVSNSGARSRAAARLVAQHFVRDLVGLLAGQGCRGGNGSWIHNGASREPLAPVSV